MSMTGHFGTGGRILLIASAYGLSFYQATLAIRLAEVDGNVVRAIVRLNTSAIGLGVVVKWTGVWLAYKFAISMVDLIKFRFKKSVPLVIKAMQSRQDTTEQWHIDHSYLYFLAVIRSFYNHNTHFCKFKHALTYAFTAPIHG